MVDMLGLEPSTARCAGSSPVPGKYKKCLTIMPAHKNHIEPQGVSRQAGIPGKYKKCLTIMPAHKRQRKWDVV